MNETLYFEPAYDSMVDAQIPEFDNNVPEYVNPEWDDDALYNLICTYQDVLVEVDGIAMTLSAAMNEHPGPWIPENEANLIAYAESLLANAQVEPLEPIEEDPEETEHEKVLEVQRLEDSPAQENVRQDQAENKSESTDQRKRDGIRQPHETPPILSEAPVSVHADTTVRKDIAKVNKSNERATASETFNHRTEPESRIDSEEQVPEVAQSAGTEQTRIHVATQPEPQVPRETPTVADEEPVYVSQPTNGIIDDQEPDNVSEPYEEMTHDEIVEPQDIETDLYDVDVLAIETPLDSPLGLAGDTGSEQIVSAGSDQLEPIEAMAEEIEGTLEQLAELIESNTPEDNEAIELVIDTILEISAGNGIITKDEWVIVYSELFEAAGIVYTHELIGSLASLTVEWNLIEEIEKLREAGYDTTAEDRSAQTIVKKLLAAFTNIIQAIRHIFAIGAYALGLCVAPRARYQ